MGCHLSIVSPVYRAAGFVGELVRQIEASVSTLTDDYEIILVEDASPDASWEAILREAARNPRVKGIKLSRNFGQHRAITAGLDHAAGRWVVVMDCDLQDRPDQIPKLYRKAEEGYDVVLARREQRQDALIKRAFSKLFYRALGYFTGTKQDAAVANFGIYSAQVVAAIQSMREPMRYFPTMVRWVGFRQTAIAVKHSSREEGKSSYNFSKLIRLAGNVILANSHKPIRFTIRLGLFVSALSFLMGIYIVVQHFTGHITQLGYASLMVSVWFLGGIILLVLGVIGLYIGKTFEGVKNRPIYIVDSFVNGNDRVIKVG